MELIGSILAEKLSLLLMSVTPSQAIINDIDSRTGYRTDWVPNRLGNQTVWYPVHQS